jgi:hypothetical protein
MCTRELPVLTGTTVTSESLVSRWTRYGHDRLYAVTADGTKLGYWDNKTRTLHPAAADHEAALREALTAFWGRDAEAEPPAPAAPALSPPPPAAEEPGSVAHVPAPSPEQPWTDLALNAPGVGARDQAIALRVAAPVKTRLARLLGVHTAERAWRVGADGEEAVAARLARLPDAWRVLHAVPIGTGASDIDHVVIGPGGVYTVNAKHHPRTTVWIGGNTFMVNGQKQPYVRNSRYEASRASEILSALAGFPVIVTGLIAVVGAHDGLTIKCQPPGGDVYVVPRKKITDWLLQRGPVLTTEQVGDLFEIARRSTTWSG